MVPFYQQMFSLYEDTSGTPTAILGCPLGATGDGCANRQSISHSSDDHEQVQTVRLDYNINPRDTTWFLVSGGQRLASRVDRPHQPSVRCVFAAAPLFFRGRIHARFLAELGELLQSCVLLVREHVWANQPSEDALGVSDCVAGQLAQMPATPIGGLDNTWIQGRRASRFFINDNLAWSRGAHELRFGTNTRIFRLNDYDFGEGTVATVTYANLQQFIHGVANTASETFPSNANEPFNFLNLDVYAQDTWKVTRTLTWTFGLRDTFNSRQHGLTRHDQSRPPSWLFQFHLS